jgi:Hypothetical protein (DUF2513)
MVVHESKFIIALDPHGRAAMTRDMELIRKIIAAIQSREDATYKPLEIPSYPEAVVARHLELMLNAGLIDALISDGVDAPYPWLSIKDLTWSGHDFASVLMNDTVWSQIKKKLTPTELSTIPLGVLKEIGVALIGQWAKNKLGLR